ncbi:hypothetical protein Tco_0010142 [Tanacetum coccineum]
MDKNQETGHGLLFSSNCTRFLGKQRIDIERYYIGEICGLLNYTFVYTDSEPGRVFWGADEELLDGGSSRVIVYGYDGLPMQLVAPPSLDYITGPEELQTPPVP